MIETAVIDLLRKSVAPQARRLGSTFFVEYGRPFKAVAVAAWVIALVMTAICVRPSSNIQPQAIPFVVSGFFLLALFLHSEFFSVRITYNDAGINVQGRWGGQNRIAWHDLDSMHVSGPGRNFVVKQKNGQKFTFNYFMSGYQSLLAEIRGRSGRSSEVPSGPPGSRIPGAR